MKIIEIPVALYEFITGEKFKKDVPIVFFKKRVVSTENHASLEIHNSGERAFTMYEVVENTTNWKTDLISVRYLKSDIEPEKQPFQIFVKAYLPPKSSSLTRINFCQTFIKLMNLIDECDDY